jgi:hypothetical protein
MRELQQLRRRASLDCEALFVSHEVCNVLYLANGRVKRQNLSPPHRAREALRVHSTYCAHKRSSAPNDCSDTLTGTYNCFVFVKDITDISARNDRRQLHSPRLNRTLENLPVFDFRFYEQSPFRFPLKACKWNSESKNHIRCPDKAMFTNKVREIQKSLERTYSVSQMVFRYQCAAPRTKIPHETNNLRLAIPRFLRQGNLLVTANQAACTFKA